MSTPLASPRPPYQLCAPAWTHRGAATRNPQPADNLTRVVVPCTATHGRSSINPPLRLQHSGGQAGLRGHVVLPAGTAPPPGPWLAHSGYSLCPVLLAPPVSHGWPPLGHRNALAAAKSARAGSPWHLAKAPRLRAVPSNWAPPPSGPGLFIIIACRCESVTHTTTISSPQQDTHHHHHLSPACGVSFLPVPPPVRSRPQLPAAAQPGYTPTLPQADLPANSLLLAGRCSGQACAVRAG